MGFNPRLVARAGVTSGEQAKVFAVSITFMVIILVAMSLRAYVRVGIIKKVGIDDLLMFSGAVITFALSAASIVAAYYGVGLHTAQLVILEDMTPMLKAVYSTRLLYVVATMLVKMSLLTFYLRLDERRSMRWTTYGVMFCVVVFSIISFFILAFSCYPPAMFWDITGTVKGSCIDAGVQQQFFDANGVINILIDLAIFLIPLPMLWRIEVPLRQKLGLVFIFGLGLVAVAAGCVRFSYVRLLANTTEMYYELADSLNWCNIEIYVAILCGSASSFKVLLRTYFPALLGNSYAYGAYGRSGNKGGNGGGAGPGAGGVGGTDQQPLEMDPRASYQGLGPKERSGKPPSSLGDYDDTTTNGGTDSRGSSAYYAAGPRKMSVGGGAVVRDKEVFQVGEAAYDDGDDDYRRNSRVESPVKIYSRLTQRAAL